MKIQSVIINWEEHKFWQWYMAWTNISINNNEISAVDTTYTAGEWIAIWQWLDYSAMRWPCDEWFHVPSYDECNFILRVTSSQYTQTPWNLIKAPSNWYIRFTNSWNYDVWFTMRTRNDQTLNSEEAYLFSYDDSDSWHVQPLVIRPKSIWAWVRWFADIPVEADETWDVLYDKTRWTIYRNEELWLISVYSKETNDWVTLQDKNVWAENVWDNWYYFQWWNNYWFTNASEATSSEKVDASWYAPSTYNEPPINTRGDWSSMRNPDLRWWVTWVVTIDNVISNTWVLSVNWQTWDITIDTWEASSITTTQPSNPVEWDIYYDTTNDVLKVYDGTNWVEVWSWIKNNTTWTTYTIQEEWVGEESQFNQLSNFWNIIYNVIE